MEDGITIQATIIQETDKAYFMDCEGDQEWFPKSQVKYDKENEDLVIPQWLFNEKFPQG